MDIYVTGASGFIGGAVARKLADEHNVFAMSRTEASDEGIRALGAEPLRSSLSTLRPGELPELVEGDQVDFRTPGLYYADPREIFEFCRTELSRHVVIRHDYPLFEFSVHVYRHART